MGEAFEAVLAALGDRVLRSGDGQASSRCPAHEDRQASLSVAVGDDSNCVVHCHAGCACSDVLSAVGLKATDLYDKHHRGSLVSAPPRAAPAKPKKPARLYATAAEAGAAALWAMGRKNPGATLTTYDYILSDGTPFGAVFRGDFVVDGEPAKDIRQATHTAEGWRLTAGKAPWPLYRLNTLPAAGTVAVCEGEKAVHAAEVLGLAATTSKGGAEAATGTDWSPLAGRDVVVFPDADDAGETYAAEVAGILAALDPPARVRIARVAGLGKGDDVADLPTGTDDELLAARRAVEAALEGAVLLGTLTAAPKPEPYDPIVRREWHDCVVEVDWCSGDRQHVVVRRDGAVLNSATLNMVSLGQRTDFVRTTAKRCGGDRDTLDMLLAQVHDNGPPPRPAPSEPAEPREMKLEFPSEIDGRPAVFVGGSGVARSIALDKCLEVFGNYFYRADEALVAVDFCRERGAHVVRAITAERLAAWIDAHVVCYQFEEGGPVAVPCPEWLSRRAYKLQAFDSVRPVNGMATGPFMRPDGTVGGYQSGYDDATGIVVHTDLEWPVVPDNPTIGEARAAADTLLEAVGTFPFKAAVDRAVWLASVLSVVGRRAFAGPCPMFVATAPVMGSGKSLLQQAASWIAAGADAPAAKLGSSDTENEKVVGAILSERPTCIVFDNVSGTLGDPTIDRLLTADVVSTRCLGSSRMITARNAFVAFANGNNLAPRGDIGRRLLHMRLEPTTDRPYEVQHDTDFRESIVTSRPALLTAALTILRYGMSLEKPPRVRRLGSYARWANVVQVALAAIGQPDPCGSQADMLDDRQDVAAELLEAVAAAAPGFCDTAGRLVTQAFERNQFGGAYVDDSAEGERLRDAIDTVVEQNRGGRPGRVDDVRVPVLLRTIEAIRDRWFGEYRLVRSTKGKHGRRWQIEARGDAWEPAT